jgi:hypothetical protein
MDEKYQRIDYSARFAAVYIRRAADPADWKLLFEQSTEITG